MKAPGMNFLKVTGILYIVFAGIDIIAAMSVMEDVSLSYQLESVIGYPLIYQLMGDLYSLFVGIMGLKYCNTLEKAKLLTTIVIVDIVLAAIQIIVLTLSSAFLWLAIPILYLVGASKNKKALEAQNSNTEQESSQ